MLIRFGLLMVLLPVIGVAQTDFSLAVQSGHTGTVRQIQTMGNLMITQSNATDIKLWDLQSGLELGLLPVSASFYGNVFVSLNPNLNEIAVANKYIAVFDMASGNEKKKLTQAKKDLAAGGVSFSPKDPILVTAECPGGEKEETNFYFFSTQKYGSPKSSGKIKGRFTQLAFSSNGNHVAICSDAMIAVYQMPAMKKVFERIMDARGGAAFSPDGNTMYVASSYGGGENVKDQYYGLPGLYIVDLKSKKIVERKSFGTSRAVAVSADGKLISVAANDGALAKSQSQDVTVLSLPDFKEVKTFRVEEDGAATFSLAFDPKGKYLITANGVGDVTFYSTVNWTKLRASTKQKVERGGKMTFVAGGKKLMVQYPKYALVWDLVKAQIAYTIVHNPDLLKKDMLLVEYIADPAGKRIVTGSEDGMIRVWDAVNGRLINSKQISVGNRSLRYVFPKYFISDDVVKLEIETTDFNSLVVGYDIVNQQGIAWKDEEYVKSADKQYVYKQGYQANSGFEVGKDIVSLYDATGKEVKRFDFGWEPQFCPQGNFLLINYNVYAASLQNVTLKDYVEFYDPSKNKTILKGSGHGGFSSTGRYAYYRPDGATSTTVYQMPEWKEIATVNHETKTWGITFSPDDKLAAVMSADGSVFVYELPSGKRRATMVNIGTELYAVVNNEGYYKAHPKAYGSLAFRKGFRAYPFEQFDLRFNRPDKVVQSMGLAEPSLQNLYHEAYKKRVSRMGFKPEQLEGELRLPEVHVTSNIPVTTNRKDLSFIVRAYDSLSSIDRINVMLNGVPVFGMQGKKVKGNSVLETVQVTLARGKNTLQVSAHNAAGVESLIQTFEIACDIPTNKPNAYVLTIGVSEFQDAAYNLTYAAKDATDLATLYANSTAFGKVNVMSITNADVLRENLIKAKAFLGQSQVEDLIVVHIATHGLLDDNLDYYLATHNVEFENPSSRGLAYQDFENLFDNINARQKLVLIDACHSGEVDKEETVIATGTANRTYGVKSRGFKDVTRKNGPGLVNSFELMRQLFADIRRGTGAVVISSASGREYAFESDMWRNGVFTYAVLSGLKNKSADKNKDGVIHVSELQEYVSTQVVDLTSGKQNPTNRSENLENDFVVW